MFICYFLIPDNEICKSELDSFIKKVNDKDFKFKFELSDSKNHVDKLENLVHEVILGFIDG